MSVLEREFARFPFAVVDVESTGLSPTHDRVVELAISLVRPGAAPELILETLVNPTRPMAATEIHGLTDGDVERAPTFAQIAPTVASALSNRVLASHNVYFDAAMLGAELERCGYPSDVPRVCTMLLPCSLGKGSRMSLRHACLRAEIALAEEHSAAADAMAAAHLLRRHFRLLRRAGVRTFGDLVRKAEKKYEFFESFEWRPLPPPAVVSDGRCLLPRGGEPRPARRAPIARYLEEVLDAVADLHLTESELACVRATRSELNLDEDEIRAVHARVFFGMIARFVEDARVDPAEVARLHRLRELLSCLGWAPGDKAIA